MYILGISAFYHDSAACLLKDGVIVGGVQEERFSRLKHDQNLPVNSIAKMFVGNKIAMISNIFFIILRSTHRLFL